MAVVERSLSDADLGNRAERARMLRVIQQLEDEETGRTHLQPRSTSHSFTSSVLTNRHSSPEGPRPAFAAATATAPSPERLRELATPIRPRPVAHSGFLRAARSRRAQGRGGMDALLSVGPEDEGHDFWLYGAQKVTQRLMGTLLGASGTTVSREALLQTPLCCALRRKIDSLLATAVSRHRCGILFDLISTSTIIRSGIPRVCGEYIYEYIESKHADKLALRFVFVGITDNTNCCAARDVFCREYDLSGRYVGDTKRQFDALDNVHMHAVFPRRGAADAEVPNPALMRPPGGPPLLRRPTAERRAKAPEGGPEGAQTDRPTTASPSEPSGVAGSYARSTRSDRSALQASTAFLTQSEAPDDEEHPPRPVSVMDKKNAFDRRDWAFFLEGLAPQPKKRAAVAGLPDLGL